MQAENPLIHKRTLRRKNTPGRYYGWHRFWGYGVVVVVVVEEKLAELPFKSQPPEWQQFYDKTEPELGHLRRVEHHIPPGFYRSIVVKELPCSVKKGTLIAPNFFFFFKKSVFSWG